MPGLTRRGLCGDEQLRVLSVGAPGLSEACPDKGLFDAVA
jgi:hypothetical protein